MLIIKRILKENKNKVWFLILLCLLFIRSEVVYAKDKRVEKKSALFESVTTTKESDIQSFGIRMNNYTNSRNKVELNSFYQQIKKEEFTNWNVNSIKACLFTKYMYFDFNAAWGIQDGFSGNSRNNAYCNQFGLQIRQIYVKNNGVGCFGINFGTNAPFPMAKVKGGFYFDIGQWKGRC